MYGCFGCLRSMCHEEEKVNDKTCLMQVNFFNQFYAYLYDKVVIDMTSHVSNYSPDFFHMDDIK